jgi:hypothetical protein
MVRATIFNCEIELSQLTPKGVVFSGSAADLRAIRAQFLRDHYIILPKLIEPDLLATILKRIASAPSVQEEDEGVVVESIINDPQTYNLFLFHLNTWHTDVSAHRMATFSLNLTAQEHRGGTLQIRYRGSDEILHEVRDTGPRDALLMRVANKLFHRVLPIEEDVPRTALAV